MNRTWRIITYSIAAAAALVALVYLRDRQEKLAYAGSVILVVVIGFISADLWTLLRSQDAEKDCGCHDKAEEEKAPEVSV